MTDSETIKRLRREFEESERDPERRCWGEKAARDLIEYRKGLSIPYARPQKRGPVETVLKIGTGLCLFAMIVWLVLTVTALARGRW